MAIMLCSFKGEALRLPQRHKRFNPERFNSPACMYTIKNDKRLGKRGEDVEGNR